ncbi:hypothetical protein QVD17_25147 [Tagetes erecta]|uniref:ZCF37 n=1 Tax=Tagetes erecta TaxID=13708 RepID=A0AAD8NUW7_TARER|nr:hypothetical protein QVD17_25147 [Tagetes erecta]
MAFICGYFRSQEEDTHKPTRPKHIFRSRSHKNTTNPYANDGIEKFEALMADLDQKRHKILTEIGSEDVSIVKFIYKSPNKIKPIIIKLQDDQKRHNTSSFRSTPESGHLKDVSFIKTINNGGNEQVVDDHTKEMKSNYQCNMKVGEWWKPCDYFSLFLILILVLLTFFGRSFAILCVSIGWYFVPIVNETLGDSKKSYNVAKKELVKSSRRLTRNKQHNRSF